MKKYKIIYADPPWRYARSKVQGAAEKHYPTMSIEELCALPVKEIADKDCILFLWATFPQLKEALQLIKAWGFTYKSVAFALYTFVFVFDNGIGWKISLIIIGLGWLISAVSGFIENLKK